MTREDEIEKLQVLLFQDPKSPEFVRLAELYIQREMITEAAELVKTSLKFHPQSTSGQILMGRCLRKLKNPKEALTPLKKATELAPENWRAWLELAETLLELKAAKESLSAFKKVLLFNPTHPTARRAVAKLEVVSADDYEDDLFEFHKPSELTEEENEVKNIETPVGGWTEPPPQLQRLLSFIDALIVRHEAQKAIDLLNECTEKFGHHPEIETRRLKLSVYEKADYIKPKSTAESSMTKREYIRHKKLKAMNELLRRIEKLRAQNLSSEI